MLAQKTMHENYDKWIERNSTEEISKPISKTPTISFFLSLSLIESLCGTYDLKRFPSPVIYPRPLQLLEKKLLTRHW